MFVLQSVFYATEANEASCASISSPRHQALNASKGRRMGKLIEPSFNGISLSLWESGKAPDGYAVRMSIKNQFAKEHTFNCVVESRLGIMIADNIKITIKAKMHALALRCRRLEDWILAEMCRLNLNCKRLGDVTIKFDRSQLKGVKQNRIELDKLIKQLHTTIIRLKKLDENQAAKFYKYVNAKESR